MVKKTGLYNAHIQLGAKMVTYAGYEMPLQYRSVREECSAVRHHLGIFDVSHMGELILEGPHALDLIQALTTNDAAKLNPGQAQYTCMTNRSGGIVDDLILYNLAKDQYMLVVNAANIEKDWRWIADRDKWGVARRNKSDETALIAVQGPKAATVLQRLTDKDLSEIEYYHFDIGRLAGVADAIISNTGYTGSGGFELYFPNEKAEPIWNKIIEAGTACGITPCGLAARDILRLEMGYCLYGNDITDSTTPLEAGLSWITPFTKRFTADTLLRNQKEAGTAKKLVAFEVTERGVPRKGYELQDENENPIGWVTSGTQSPALKKGIGLGYVKTAWAQVGTTLRVKVRDKTISAQIVKPPFYQKNR
ncbi:MAG: glycine cleavage system aminomethyltransferase GcvT [Flavobacteriales bacterium]